MVPKPSPALPRRPVPIAPTEERWRAMTQPERDSFLEEVLDALSLEARVKDLETHAQEAEAQAEQANRSAEQANRDAQRALAGMRRAIVAFLTARGIACSEEGRARIDACAEPELLDLWLSRATTAGSEAEVFSGA